MRNIFLLFLFFFLQLQASEAAERLTEIRYFKTERLVVDHKVVEEKITPLLALPSARFSPAKPFLGCYFDIVNPQSDEEGRGFLADKVTITCSEKPPVTITGRDTSIFAGDERFEIKGSSNKWGIVFSIEDSTVNAVYLLRVDGSHQIIRVSFFPSMIVGLKPSSGQSTEVSSQGRQITLLKLPIIEKDTISLRIQNTNGGDEQLLVIKETGEWKIVE